MIRSIFVAAVIASALAWAQSQASIDIKPRLDAGVQASTAHHKREGGAELTTKPPKADGGTLAARDTPIDARLSLVSPAEAISLTRLPDVDPGTPPIPDRYWPPSSQGSR